MSRFLVVGGAGFVGSTLCELLVDRGEEVICVDNLLTGRMQNIERLLDNDRFEFLNQTVQGAEITGTIDYVAHLGSPASPKDYALFPLETLEAGSSGTQDALKIARDHEAVFLLASSSEVYGDPEINPQPESYWGNVNPVGPRSVYDEAKRFGEALTVAYSQVYGLQIRIARIFNTYGPGMRATDGRAVPTFVRQALGGQPLTVYGDGSQTRSLCYIDDLVDGLYRLLLVDAMSEAIEYPDPFVVNLGNPDEISMIDLAHEIIEVAGSSSEVVFEGLPIDDPKVRRPDITRARALLGWEPEVLRRDGLERVVAHFRSHPDPVTTPA